MKVTRIKVIIHSRLIQEQAYRFSIYTDTVPRYFAARNIRSTVTPMIYLHVRPIKHPYPPPVCPRKFLLSFSLSPFFFFFFLFPRFYRANFSPLSSTKSSFSRALLLSSPVHDSRTISSRGNGIGGKRISRIEGRV